MSSIDRGLIEYRGLDTCIKGNLKNFKQVNYENTFSIPCQKPDMEQIVRVDSKASIFKYEVIKTPIGVSLEGQEVTGHKLLVCGDINYKLQYVANEPTQSVHTFHQTVPFCGYIVLPKKFNAGAYINPSTLIEDISVQQIDSRCVYSNITMLLVANISC